LTEELSIFFQDCLPFGSANFTRPASLSSACGSKLQLCTWCLASLANLTLATLGLTKLKYLDRIYKISRIFFANKTQRHQRLYF